MFKCQREGKNILLEYFWFVFSVLSVRIILDIAYSRNMAGSWARDWESHCRVSPVPCVWNLQLQPQSLTKLFLLFVPRLDFLSIINISKQLRCWVSCLAVCRWELLPPWLVQVRAVCVLAVWELVWRKEDSLSTLTGSGAASSCADVLLLKMQDLRWSPWSVSAHWGQKPLEGQEGPTEDGKWWQRFSGWERLTPGFPTGLSQVGFIPGPSSLSGISKSQWAGPAHTRPGCLEPESFLWHWAPFL